MQPLQRDVWKDAGVARRFAPVTSSDASGRVSADPGRSRKPRQMESGIPMEAALSRTGMRRRVRWLRQVTLAALLLSGATVPAAGESGRVVPLESLAPTAKHRNIARAAIQSIDRHVRTRLWMKGELGARILQHFLEAWDPERDLLLLADARELERQWHGIGEVLRNGELHFAFDAFKRIKVATGGPHCSLHSPAGYRVRFWSRRAPGNGRQSQRLGAESGDARGSLAAAREERCHRALSGRTDAVRNQGHAAHPLRRVARSGQANRRRRHRRTRPGRIRTCSRPARGLPVASSNRTPASPNHRCTGRDRGGAARTGRVRGSRTTHAWGPADRRRALGVGDRILGIGQTGEPWPTDVVGWPIAAVVDRLRGPKDTAVRLRILPAGVGTVPRTITLIRDRIALADRAARGRIVRFEGFEQHERRIGVIDVPSFHVDGRTGQVRDSTSSDVRRIVRRLRAQGIDGLVLDLRRNRGGSLNQAVRTAGLFITTGPIVQVRNLTGEIQVRNDPDPGRNSSCRTPGSSSPRRRGDAGCRRMGRGTPGPNEGGEADRRGNQIAGGVIATSIFNFRKRNSRSWRGFRYSSWRRGRPTSFRPSRPCLPAASPGRRASSASPQPSLRW